MQKDKEELFLQAENRMKGYVFAASLKHKVSAKVLKELREEYMKTLEEIGKRQLLVEFHLWRAEREKAKEKARAAAGL